MRYVNRGGPQWVSAMVVLAAMADKIVVVEAGFAQWHRCGWRTQLKAGCFSVTLLCAVEEFVARMWRGAPSSGNSQRRENW